MQTRRLTRIQRLGMGTAAVTLAAALAGCGGTDPAAQPSQGTGSQGAGSQGTQETSGGQETSGAQATSGVEAHNAQDVMFLQMMLPHHEQAVQMSTILLNKEQVDPKVAELARQIKQAQKSEVTTMTQWLTTWGEPTSMEGDHAAMDGMLTAQQMDRLRKAPGAEASLFFVRHMIGHHEGAVDMAKTQIKSGQNPDVTAMAHAVVETQQAEITTMQKMEQRLTS